MCRVKLFCPSVCVWFRGNIPLNFALWRGFEYPVMRNIRFFFLQSFLCFVCRDLTINLNFITLTPLAHLTWVCTAPSSGHNVLRNTKEPHVHQGSCLAFYFLCCEWFKTGSQGKTTALGLTKHSSVLRHNFQPCAPMKEPAAGNWPSWVIAGEKLQLVVCLVSKLLWVQEVEEEVVHAALKRLRLYTVAVGHKTWADYMKVLCRETGVLVLGQAGLDEGIAELWAVHWRSCTNLTHDFHSPLRGTVSFDLLGSFRLVCASLVLLYLLLYWVLVWHVFISSSSNSERHSISKLTSTLLKTNFQVLAGWLGFLVSILIDSSRSKFKQPHSKK